MSRRRKPVRRHPAKMERRYSRPRHLQPPSRDQLTDDYQQVYVAVVAYCLEFGLEPERAWSTMIYACAGTHPRPGSTGCGWEHRVWLQIGVEGPPPLRDERTFVPAPFYCGRCPDCGGSLCHDRWDEDEVFAAPGREIPEDAARFRLPDDAEWLDFAERNYGGAAYSDPTGRTR